MSTMSYRNYRPNRGADPIMHPESERGANAPGRGIVIPRAEITPIERPVVSQDFETLSWPVRVCEALQYQALRLEYFVSPGGVLRFWTRQTILLALMLLVPAALLLPVILLAAGQIVTLSEAVMLICQYLFSALIYMIKMAGIIFALLLGARVFMSSKRKRR